MINLKVRGIEIIPPISNLLNTKNKDNNKEKNKPKNKEK